MAKLRDIALIIAAAVLVFFAGSNIDLSSGLEENALYLAVQDALQADESGDAGESEDVPSDSASVDDDGGDSGEGSQEDIELSIEVSLEPDITIAYPSGSMVEFTLTIANTTEDVVTIKKIEDDQFGFLSIVDGKCVKVEEEPVFSEEIKENGEFTCKYQGEVKAAAGETFTNTVSVKTQEEKVATASVDTEISKSITEIFPRNQITILGKNGWPLIKNNVISEPVNLVIRDNNTETTTVFIWGPVYSPTSGKSVDISIAKDSDYFYEIEKPIELSKVTLVLVDKKRFLPPGEYTTEIFIDK